ncbi:MAG: hypothetical protein AAF152_09665 [Cyanobacteria bacterium P01_A01_bin.114]
MQHQSYRGLTLQHDPTASGRWIAYNRGIVFYGSSAEELKQKIDSDIQNRPFALATMLVNNPDTAAVLQASIRYRQKG